MAKYGYLAAALVLLPLCVPSLIKEGRAAQACDAVQAAEVRDAQAQFELGRVCLSEGGDRNLKKARVLFGKAAGQGHNRALYYASVMSDEGLGGARDRNKAIQSYRKAANAGDPDAMFSLSKLYDEGTGNLKKDRKKAQEWYERAVKQWESGVEPEVYRRHPE